MKQTFCILPWVHILPKHSGNVIPCCMWQGPSIGNTLDKTLYEIAHGKEMDNIRHSIMNGTLISGCASCNEKNQLIESNNLPITSYNASPKLTQQLLSDTNTDGSLKSEFKLRYMNFRFSNLCNYSCRSCGPVDSSKIAQEQKNPIPIKIISKEDEIYRVMFDNLLYAEEINFAGGESVIMPQYWNILDRLIELGNTSVKITYVTNLSKLEFQKKNLLDYIKVFDNFHLRASIDASHQRGEIYRNGTNWNKTENILRILNRENAQVSINCTVGATNILHCPDLEQYLIENELIKANKFDLNFLHYPKLLNSRILPTSYKKRVTTRIENHISWLTQHNININRWSELIEFMNFSDDSYLLPNFISYHNKLDSIRKQNIFEAFPELNDIKYAKLQFYAKRPI